MYMSNAIPVVDIFAGPGGLGEGFSAYRAPKLPDQPIFRLAISAEVDLSALETLRLRSFVRKFNSVCDVPDRYYEFLRGAAKEPWDRQTKAEWDAAAAEACGIELGKPRGDAELDARISDRISPGEPWVLIGGPPCQAYSVVGRARNRGKADYRADHDDRHFLYRSYLSVLAKHRPVAFIMENVKGILSSTVSGRHIFQQILADLANPGAAMALPKRQRAARYRIIPLVEAGADTLDLFDDTHDWLTGNPGSFIVRSEHYGIPQRRHRVILLGVRTDVSISGLKRLVPSPPGSVRDALAGLPAVRSGLSNQHDSTENWIKAVLRQRDRLLRQLKHDRQIDAVADSLLEFRPRESLTRGSNQLQSALDRRSLNAARHRCPELFAWLLDPRLGGVANHDTREHMNGDLGRYLFCATFGRSGNRQSPKRQDFPRCLAPSHASWARGDFADRFRVQVADEPSTTVMSHIAKDGHYYIHHDPTQCRSLTVREAARLQTFPDNYFFCGNRTERYTQVGNAVPPLLARQIAGVVASLLVGRPT